MKLYLFTIFLLLEIQNAKQLKTDEIHAVATLTKQLYHALTEYISDCNLVPVDNSCKKQKRTMEIKDGQDLGTIHILRKQ